MAEDPQPLPRASGRVTKDPTESLTTVETLNFNGVLVPPIEDDRSWVWLADWGKGAIGGVLLYLLVAEGDSYRVLGSAVIVAPGVALCASHVLDGEIEAIASGKTPVIAVCVTEHGLQFWAVRHGTLVNGTDLTLLTLGLRSALPTDLTFNMVTLTTRVPRVAEKLTIVGFRPIERTYTLSDDSVLRIRGDVMICTGEVTDYFPKGRPLMPWPILQVSCPTWKGMSGGPAFDQHGKLVGVLCRGWDTDDNKGPSYISMHYLALGMPFQGGWPANAYRPPVSLLEMDPQLCVIDRREAIRVKHLPEEKIETTYDEW